MPTSGLRSKQLALKPQDLLVVIKIAANPDRTFTYGQLAVELAMSASEVHAACSRAERSRLLFNDNGRLSPIGSALREFIIHGAKYAFPAIIGPTQRGVATGVGASPLKQLFIANDELPPVWPDSEGSYRGPSLQPLYPTVAFASQRDQKLYELLALLDAIRGGAAREREAATAELMRRL